MKDGAPGIGIDVDTDLGGVFEESFGVSRDSRK